MKRYPSPPKHEVFWMENSAYVKEKVKNACEKYIKASYNFILRNYGENFTQVSQKTFQADTKAIINQLQIAYEKALITNYQRTQNIALRQKTKAIDVNLLIEQHCKSFQKIVQTLLQANYQAKCNTQPEPTTILS